MDESKPTSSEVGPEKSLEKPASLTEVVTSDDEQRSDYSDEALIADWTTAEETALVRKLDCIVMPLMILGLTALQYDRANIGNAVTDDFLPNIGIDQSQFNVGQQLLSVGIVLLEIPSNLILYRIGPPIWISCQMFIWGLVAMLQAFQKNLAGYYSTRLILGLCEAGFIPAALFSITQWYKREETSKRFAWFFTGNLIASATAGLIAYGILQMRGICNLTGWQWLFILEGLFTILCAFVFASLFPNQPRNPVTLLKINYFTERERHILLRRVMIDDPSKGQKKRTITKAQLLATLSNWRIYPHILLTFCGMSTQQTYSSYAPTLVAAWGYGKLRSNALVSVGYWVLLVTTLIYGWIADKIGKRGPVVLVGLIISWGFVIGMLVIRTTTDKRLHFAIFTLTLGFSNPWHATNGSWLALNAPTPAARSITMAMFIMAANCAGIAGSQFFQASDKLSGYKTGWTVIVSMNSLAIIACIVALSIYILGNRRIERGESIDVVEGGERILSGVVDGVGVREGEGDGQGIGTGSMRARVVKRGFYI